MLWAINRDGTAQNLGELWVLPAITYQVLAFQKTLQKEPPVPFPAPEPYSPKK